MVVVNKSKNTIAIFFFDGSNQEQQMDLAPGASASLVEPLHPTTAALLASGKLAVRTDSPVTPIAGNAAGAPMFWTGTWRKNGVYKLGFVTIYAGKTFVAKKQLRSSTPPSIDDPSWEYAASLDLNAYFGFDISVATNGSVPWFNRNLNRWELTQLTGANIEAVPVEKVTGLAGVIAGFVPTAGGSMTGPLILSAMPNADMEAAPKRYVDTFVSRAGGEMTGLLKLSGNPTDPLHAVPLQYIDNFVPKSGGTMTGALVLIGNPVNPLEAAPKQYVDSFLSKSGGTMTGTLVLNGNPASNLHAATKQYVDGFLSKAGGTMAGALVLAGNPTASLEAAPKQYVDGFLSKAGGTMAGAISLPGNPTNPLEAAPKQYVDRHLQKAGGTMTGALVLAGNPTDNLHAAPKQYVDGFLAKTGGAMSGPITGTHGLLPLAGGNMTGEIGLFAKTLNGANVGLYEASTHAVPGWKGALLQMTSPPMRFKVDHLLLPNELVAVFTGTNRATLNVSSTALKSTPIAIVNDGTATLFVVGASNVESLQPGEGISIFPQDGDFVLLNKAVRPLSVSAFDIDTIGADANGVRAATIKQYTIVNENSAISVVASPSAGVLRFTIASGTNILVGTPIRIVTNSYAGDYVVEAVSGNDVDVRSPITFVGSETGTATVRRRNASSTLADFYMLLANTANLPWDGAANATVDIVSGVTRAEQTGSGNGLLITPSGGTVVADVSNGEAEARSLFLHIIGAARLAPLYEVSVLGVEVPIQDVLDSSDHGGDIQLELASTDGWRVGDMAVLTGDIVGQAAVLAVISGPPRIRLDFPFQEVTPSLVQVSNKNSVLATVQTTAGLLAGDVATAVGIDAIGSSSINVEVVTVMDTSTVFISNPLGVFDELQTSAGVLKKATVEKVDFLVADNESSSSSSINSSSSSTSSVNSSSSSSSSNSSSSSPSSNSSSSTSSNSSSSSSII